MKPLILDANKLDRVAFRHLVAEYASRGQDQHMRDYRVHHMPALAMLAYISDELDEQCSDEAT